MLLLMQAELMYGSRNYFTAALWSSPLTCPPCSADGRFQSRAENDKTVRNRVDKRGGNRIKRLSESTLCTGCQPLHPTIAAAMTMRMTPSNR
ncbi:hypothetical protein JOB18_035047 [Solea senegalensis]|uniref:Secreted protein n=1 Tax=Solea senegalensis TaxID=28829 RepID=A0AAV6SHJ7_SOLSE|nr:hypothetical protein JOB18_035047 [Solea senegalensis]